eukprot:TRINITY_DN731_c0_g1_i1.p2 TRINITY_DN731_c0_g1~~TRINITY_DN731_c0_g1_i1.p2  ORF type:complete len:239 (-),score=41.23 TRINITY_DN731_c0_g1_i1:178-894(-)
MRTPLVQPSRNLHEEEHCNSGEDEDEDVDRLARTADHEIQSDPHSGSHHAHDLADLHYEAPRKQQSYAGMLWKKVLLRNTRSPAWLDLVLVTRVLWAFVLAVASAPIFAQARLCVYALLCFHTWYAAHLIFHGYVLPRWKRIPPDSVPLTSPERHIVFANEILLSVLLLLFLLFVIASGWDATAVLVASLVFKVAVVFTLLLCAVLKAIAAAVALFVLLKAKCLPSTAAAARDLASPT